MTEAQYWILFNDTFVRCKKEGVKHVDLRDYAIHCSLLWLQPGKKETQLIMPGETLTFSDEVTCVVIVVIAVVVHLLMVLDVSIGVGVVGVVV